MVNLSCRSPRRSEAGNAPADEHLRAPPGVAMSLVQSSAFHFNRLEVAVTGLMLERAVHARLGNPKLLARQHSP
jgi:hypothetical protein